ncbi:sensor histidine kinase [Sphingobacterium sp. SYP-B4668]|uniref:sensor histidine kinase n=1 Tax=Sphingobacterium sp. SYP-B4668 TaxID=2996035 RepID=UPI0022DD2BED|nr:sensor histidine kinase [Sphingobacterium sp. SYP-B4668]
MTNARKAKHPFISWAKETLIFSFATTSLAALVFYTEGYRDVKMIYQSLVTFFVIFSVTLTNLFIHVAFKVEDPVKSPVKVKLISFASTVLIIFCVSLVENYLDISRIDTRVPLPKGNWEYYLYLIIQACLLNFITLLWLYFLMSQHVRVQHEIERSRLEKAKEEAVNQLLRQQIQPHFLFNALNTLKALIHKDARLAEQYLIKLSDFLRISIVADPQGLSTVQEEVKLCLDYLDMQKMRFNEALEYKVDIPPTIAEKGTLLLFSMQPLVDNAIKHNYFTREQPLLLSIYEEEGWIVVRNNKSKRRHVVDSAKSGLNNLVERYRPYLEMGVVVSDRDDEFEVKIKIMEK